MLRKHKAFTLSITLVGIVAVTSIVLAKTGAERPDCPGKIVCPQTGEQICRDKCPTADATRADCPGRIVGQYLGSDICRNLSGLSSWLGRYRHCFGERSRHRLVVERG